MASQDASFAGQMRRNLVAMLGELCLPGYLHPSENNKHRVGQFNEAQERLRRLVAGWFWDAGGSLRSLPGRSG